MPRGKNLREQVKGSAARAASLRRAGQDHGQGTFRPSLEGRRYTAVGACDFRRTDGRLLWPSFSGDVRGEGVSR